jgi:hypothetical protein
VGDQLFHRERFTSLLPLLPLDQVGTIPVPHLTEPYSNQLVTLAGNDLTHVIRLDRQLAVPTVAQNRELNLSWAAKIDDGVEG